MKPTRELEIGNQGSEGKRNNELLEALRKASEKNVEKLEEEIPSYISDSEPIENVGITLQDDSYYLVIQKNSEKQAFELSEKLYRKLRKEINQYPYKKGSYTPYPKKGGYSEK